MTATTPEICYEGGVWFRDDLDPFDVEFLAGELMREEEATPEVDVCFVKGVIEAREPCDHPTVESLKEKVIADFQDKVFRSKLPPELPPVRGPFGEAEINLKVGARPVKQRMFHITGERRDAWDRLTNEVIAAGKVEPGVGPWSSPSFPVPKKNPGEYRLVEDFRAVNENTEDDAHPLPRIEEMVQRQSEFRMWSSLDCKDGYHQMPLKKEHRHITCMSTPKGTYQWRVQVMGLKNAGAQFQRMMEWILRDHDFADPYIDDIIVGSNGSNDDELISNHEKDIRAVLETLAEHQIYVDPRKAHLFMREVEFCGHVLREGRRSPAPGKLRVIQKWEAPKTVTQLRGFLGLTNYYSGYVKGYAGLATPLMDLLKVNKADGKKGSQKPIKWGAKEEAAFTALKGSLSRELELFQMDVSKPYTMRTDASEWAIGGVLEQDLEGKLVPVAFYSRKLGGSQLNWTPREKECYAIVCCLRKWAGWIGFQPVTIMTDHRSLEEWAHENLDTPSGPRGRKARWHETLSQFKLEVKYIPGKDNIVADAMSRYAYPASSAREDVSFHGSAKAKEEVRGMLAREKLEEREMGEEMARNKECTSTSPAGEGVGELEAKNATMGSPERQVDQSRRVSSRPKAKGIKKIPPENSPPSSQGDESPQEEEVENAETPEINLSDPPGEQALVAVITRSGRLVEDQGDQEEEQEEESAEEGIIGHNRPAISTPPG
jgi:hypothetical protein